MSSGSVTKISQNPTDLTVTEISVDSHVTIETIRILKTERTPAEIDAAFDQASAFIGKLVNTFENEIAVGEVGSKGSSIASEKPPICGKSPAALLYGRIQSGKTQAMILSTALAFDNNFRVVVILTSDSVELVKQTFTRFAVLKEAGVNVFSSNSTEEWERETAHASEHLPKHGIVIVSAKNRSHLEKLNNFLFRIGAPSYPAIIFDDEADQASLDTNNRKRSLEVQDGGNPNEVPGSAINELIVGVDSLTRNLRHSIYVQVTATPFAMLLLNQNDALRPSTVHLLEPGTGYTGGETFFDDEILENGRPPLSFVAENELKDAMAQSHKPVPQGLKRSIAYFVIASIVQRMLSPVPVRVQCMLCHPGGQRSSHDAASKMISDFFSELARDLSSNQPLTELETRGFIEWALDELGKTIGTVPALSEIRVQAGRGILRTRKFHIVNSEAGGGFAPEPGLNFVIGGNIIGRGLTIENLLVTYYVRPAQIGQMDTMYQHARMFGYRSKIIEYVRVFVPLNLSVRFNAIHLAECALRDYLEENGTNPNSFIMTIPGLRPTRPNVLDPSNLATILPNPHIFPKQTPIYKPGEVSKVVESIRRAVQDAMGGALKASEFIQINIATIKSLIDLVPVHPEDIATGAWDPDFLKRVLDYVEGTHGPVAYIYYREMTRNVDIFTQSGSSTGKEKSKAWEKNAPVLMLFRESSKRVGYDFWYPTLLLPKTRHAMVTNAS